MILARALVFLAEAPRGIATSAEIANALGAHPVIVRRVLGVVRRSGLVEARSGPGGGWAIARDPSTVRLSDLYAAQAQTADQAPRSELDRALAAAEDAFVARLHDVTLADLIRHT